MTRYHLRFAPQRPDAAPLDPVLVPSMSDIEPCVYQTLAASPLGQPRTIVVAAPTRGGTSLVSSILNHIGVPLDARPPKYEHVALRDIMLERRGEGLEKEIARLDAKFPTWGWKLPFLARKLESTAEKLRNPHFILIYKDVAAIGLRKRINREKLRAAIQSDEASRQEDVLRSMRNALQAYLRMVEFASAETHPCLIVSFEKSASNKGELVRSVAAFCGIAPEGLDVDAILEKLKQDHEGYKQGNTRQIARAQKQKELAQEAGEVPEPPRTRPVEAAKPVKKRKPGKAARKAAGREA